jgi:hypothetical protein
LRILRYAEGPANVKRLEGRSGSAWARPNVHCVIRRRSRCFCTRIPTRCQQGQEADVVRFAFPVFLSPSVWPKQPWRWLMGSSLYRVTRWKDMKWRIIVGVGIVILIIVIVVPIVKAYVFPWSPAQAESVSGSDLTDLTLTRPAFKASKRTLPRFLLSLSSFASFQLAYPPLQAGTMSHFSSV